MKKKIAVLTLYAMLLALGVNAEAQQSKVAKIGELVFRSGSGLGPGREAFRQQLRELGYVEGKNIAFETRSAESKLDRIPALAEELARLKVDVLLASSINEALAFKNATRTIPIVFVLGSDPVLDGLVDSLARPGGNLTGFTNFAVETSGKRLELFKEAVPKIVRVALLYDPNNRANSMQVEELRTVARPLGLVVHPREVRTADDFDKVFEALSKQRPSGLFVPGGTLMNANDKRIAGFALKSRLPSFFARREGVEAGGLMSYDPDGLLQYRRAAIYVDKILKGAKPMDLPVEQPMKFDFIVNLRTAKQIGVTIPPNVLARQTE
jgi:putative tryptophan/tyrosine transport system substrate-binding protein